MFAKGERVVSSRGIIENGMHVSNFLQFYIDDMKIAAVPFPPLLQHELSSQIDVSIFSR